MNTYEYLITIHVTCPEPLSDAEMDWAEEDLMRVCQYVGTSEADVGPVCITIEELQ